MPFAKAQHKFDHVVSVMFENRSFDNLLGRLYAPGEVSAFEGVIGKALSNPVPEWASQGAERGIVPYGVSRGMDVPNPDARDDFTHVTRQLCRTIAQVRGPTTAAEHRTVPLDPLGQARRSPTMDGFVGDYIEAFTSQVGRQPTNDEFAQIMTGYVPRQLPVISTLARSFATFDHWFSDVPSQALPNRSFYHAATASGFVTNTPYSNFPFHNDAETVFERLDAAGLTWRVYVDPCMRCSVTGMIHARRLAEQFSTNFSSLDDFFDHAEDGRLPAYSFIEPCLVHSHNDYHPASGGVFVDGLAEAPSAVLGGEELLARIYTAVRTSSSQAGGSNFANTLLLVTFDTHGGTYDHVVPPRAPPPDPSAPPGEHGFRFDRAGLRVPTVAVSAYIEPETVVTRPFTGTSLISTLRERWPLGPPLTARDARAPSLVPILTRRTPLPQEDWPEVTPRSVPRRAAPPVWTDEPLAPLGRTLLGLAIALDTHGTSHVPDLDLATTTKGQAIDYLRERTPRIWPGLFTYAV